MSEYLGNVSYFFIPFTFEKPRCDANPSFASVVDELERSERWLPVDDKLSYMFRYITDKIRSDDPELRLCTHMKLAPGAADELGIPSSDCDCATLPHRHQGEQVTTHFRLLDVQLFCFSTSVCIIALRTSFDTDDPYRIAAAQFHLKRCSREGFRIGSESGGTLTLLEVARRALAGLSFAASCDFFYYADIDRARSNTLTFLEVPPKDDYRKELFFLRRCYDDGFVYRDDPIAEQKEIYYAAEETAWGITSEAAICLSCPGKCKVGFIKNVFYANFNTQYLFMYVFLLHQKYTLYYFLASVSAKDYDNLQLLKRYQQRLYEFEANFEYSRITEVPQYQNLYDRVAEAFALKQLFHDVREPMQALADLKADAAEQSASQREKSISRALVALSILTVFSALTDSFDFAGNLQFIGQPAIDAIRIACVVLIIGVAAWVICNVVKHRKG